MLISPPESYEVAQRAGPRESSDSCVSPAAPKTSDGQLLRRYLAGREEAAFTQLVTRFGPLVYAVALRSLRDRHAAEDVFQATFLVLARDARKIRSPDSLGAWLHGTALRIARRALARRRHEVFPGFLEDVMPAEDDSLLEEISEQFQQQLVDEELQRLPAAYRDPLVLHFLEGKTCEETAAALGTTVGAVRGRLQRGKRELKLRLMRRGVEATSVVAAIFMWQTLAEAAMQPPLVAAAVKGGMATSAGASFVSACSPEAVHLAAKETTMFTTGKLLGTYAAVLCAVAAGWFAHAGVDATPSPSADVLLDTVTDEPVPHGASLQLDAPLAFAGAGGPQAAAASKTARPTLKLNYDDGKPDGKKSLGGTGEMIRFTLPDKSQKLRSLRVHCARYGYPQPPDEDVEVNIVSEDGTDVVHTAFVPYSTFKRGDSRWTTIRLEEEIEVPETFWVILEFNAGRTKGVYVSYDTSTGGEYSKTGVPGGEPKDVTFDGDWMMQAILTKPE